MTEAITAEAPAISDASETTGGGRIPPQPRMPKILQTLGFAVNRQWLVAHATRRYGDVVTLDMPVFGQAVFVADPRLAKQVFTANTDDVGNIQPNLSRVLGPGSVFALDGAEHRRRRKLLTPPFHGKSVKNYERIFEEETLREAARWPEGKEFETLAPMNRITLNTILRAVFGAEGTQLGELQRIIPPWVTLGSRLAVLPMPSRTYGRFSPWGRLARYRATYDEVVGRLIEDVRADPNLETRDDVLSLLLRSTYEDGTAMSNQDICDELLTLLAAGHETTASTLAWVFERITRHPEVLAKLVAEAATDDNTYRQAVILEVQRSRTVIDFAGRHVYAPSFEFGEWSVPQGCSIVIPLNLLHDRGPDFSQPERFDPQRFVDNKPSMLSFVPYGGGTRRCVGAVFANVEMDVVLRTVLRHFIIEPTTAPDEKAYDRGVAFTPKSGGRAVMRRRTVALGS